jgi:branched-chain amino acid transport system substrate-binding protein
MCRPFSDRKSRNRTNAFGWLQGVLLFAALGLVAGCGPDVVRFGAILDESGDVSVYGRSVRRGIELAMDHVNAEPDKAYKGKPVEVLFRDSKMDPTVARAAFNELVDEHGTIAVIGAVSSAITLDLCPLADEKEHLLLSPASSSPRISGCGAFVARIYPSDVLEAHKLADFARKKLFIKRAAVLAVQNAYGLGLKTEFVRDFRERDGEVVSIVNYPESESDFNDEVARALENDPQALYLIGYANHLKNMVRTIHDLAPVDSDGQPVRVLSCGAFDSQEILSETCPGANNVIFPRPAFDVDDTDPVVQAFVTAYRDRYGEDPDTFAAHGYDALRLLVDAVRSRESTYPGEIQFFVVTLQKWVGVTGETTISPEGNVTTRFPRIFIVKNCRFEDIEKLVAAHD